MKRVYKLIKSDSGKLIWEIDSDIACCESIEHYLKKDHIKIDTDYGKIFIYAHSSYYQDSPYKFYMSYCPTCGEKIDITFIADLFPDLVPKTKKEQTKQIK